MLLSRQPIELPTLRNSDLEELSGALRRPGPALHVKADGHRVVERRATELRRLQRQFSGGVTRTSRFQDDSLEVWRSDSYVPARQRWCPRLERDVRAVCSEAGLSPAAASAVVDASRRGVISQNPGVLLSRLLRFQECLSTPLGRRGVLCLLRSAPSLLRYSPDSLGWNAEMLAALLPDGDAVAAAVRKAPMLLGASAITIWGNFEGLRRLLRLDHDAALRLVVRAPRLLLNSRGALEGRLEGLMLLAGGGATRRTVAAAVARQPALLGYFPGTLERNLRAAAAVLGVPFSRVQPLLLKQPALAMLARESLADRVASLRDAAGLADPADLACVVLRQPSLLTLSPETVRRKVAVVESVLGLKDRPEELRAVLRGAPQLLTLAADSILAKAAALRAATAPCAALAAQLERAAPQTVALWLCMSSRRYERVREVAEVEGRETATVGASASEAEVAAGGEAAGPRPNYGAAAALAAPRGFGEEGLGSETRAGAGPGVLVDAGGAAAEVSGLGGGAPPVRRGRGRPRRALSGGAPEGSQLLQELHSLEQPAVAAPAGEAEGCGEASAERAEPRRSRLSLYSILRDAASVGADSRAAAASVAPVQPATAAAAAAAAVVRPTVAAQSALHSAASTVADAVMARGGAKPGRKSGPAAATAVAGTGASAAEEMPAAGAGGVSAPQVQGTSGGSGPRAARPRARLRLRPLRMPRVALGL